MGDIQLYRKGNYVILIDSTDSNYIEDKSSNVLITKGTLAGTNYNIYIGGKRYLNQPIAEIKDEADVAYASAAVFEDWYYNSTAENVDVSRNGVRTSKTSSATSQTLIAANPARKGVWISNLADKNCFIAIGASPAIVDNDSLLKSVDGVFIGTTEAIYVIHEAAPAGNIVAREFL